MSFSAADFSSSIAVNCPPVLEPLQATGFIAASDVHVVRTIHRYLFTNPKLCAWLEDQANQEAVFIGIALASASTRQSHMFADLANLPTTFTLGTEAAGYLPPDIWPFSDERGPDIAKWKAALLSVPQLCVDATAHTVLPASFLVLEGDYLYLRRYYDLELQTAELVANRLATSKDPLVNPYKATVEAVPGTPAQADSSLPDEEAVARDQARGERDGAGTVQVETGRARASGDPGDDTQRNADDAHLAAVEEAKQRIGALKAEAEAQRGIFEQRAREHAANETKLGETRTKETKATLAASQAAAKAAYDTYQRALEAYTEAIDGYYALLFKDNLAQQRFGCYGLQPKPDLHRAIEHVFGGDKEQKQAAISALTSRFTVLAGGPGTGKTATVANIVALAQTQTIGSGKDGIPSIAIAAIAGKAASRVKEALGEAVPNLLAKEADFDQPLVNQEALNAVTPVTIAKLLGESAYTIGRPVIRSPKNPHPYDLLIIDEMSMVSLNSLHDILYGLDPNTHILFVGDPNQLQSIQTGTTLLDVMKGAREHGYADHIIELQTNYRSDKTISNLAKAVIDGDGDRVCELLTWLDTTTVEATFASTIAGFMDVAITQRPSAKLLGDGLIDMVKHHRERVMTLAKAGKDHEALRESLRFGVLGVHRKGLASVEHWNNAMDYLVHQVPTPYGLPDEVAMYHQWAGRPVLVTKNDPKIDVSNGDIGVMYQLPTVEPAPEPGTSKRQYRIILEGKQTRYQPFQLSGLTTVHALTVHKSQGSQYEHVIVLLPPESSPLLTRELLYTGITRAKEKVLIVGSEAILREAIANRQERASNLANKIGLALQAR